VIKDGEEEGGQEEGHEEEGCEEEEVGRFWTWHVLGGLVGLVSANPRLLRTRR
jgi:hypothetical protein